MASAQAGAETPSRPSGLRRGVTRQALLALGSAGLMAVILALGGPGCRTAHPETPKTDSLASVVIYGADPLDIRRAAREVFLEEQFMQALTNATLMTFEKRGSVLQDITYGSFLNNESWIRAKLTIKPLEENQHWLECRVFMVRNYGESFFEEERKVSRFKRGHYQDLLEEIRLRVLDSSVPREPDT